MDLQLSSYQVVAPEPRPVMTCPSTAAREQDPKPEPIETKPSRRPDHGRAHGMHRQRGRSHVQQGIHQIVREIRHAFRDELKASDVDLETMGSISDLQRDFRRDLHAVFLESGSLGGIDRNQVLEGMIEALQGLAAGLRELTGDDGVEGNPQPEKLGPEPQIIDNEPGSLLDVTG